MKTIVYYEVGDNYSVDGMAPHGYEIIGCFSQKSDALIFNKGKGNYGADAYVRERVIHICDCLEEIEDIENLKAKETALAKLTDAEIKLLGLERG